MYWLMLDLETMSTKPDSAIIAIGAMEDGVRELERLSGIDGLKDFSLKKRLTSAFRRIIGNGQTNHIMVSANHRAWRHMIALRTSAAAMSDDIKLPNEHQDVILPCPFCGSTDVSVEQGDTFRWRVAICRGCGARAPEVRAQTMGDGSPNEWEERAVADAIAAWNTRAQR